uniref:Anther-specific proline-rich protein APG n=1 Tax=Zea mays TaxID=4577 RepID=B6TWV3_MAIZE|nr:anther-specific proline-rich protein APG precursor [Zea mays]
MAPSRALHRPSLLATAAALLLLILPPSAAAAVPAPALFIFGDSLVDAGNNDYLVTLSKANGPPYGIDFESSGGKPTGRFTNGMTIADIMGESLGQKSLAPPFLAPNSSAAITSSGINYGSGSSGIFDDTGSFYIGRIPLGQQVSYFANTRSQMLETMDEEAVADFFSKALFVIVAGSNDILEFLSPSVPFLGREKPDDPSHFQDALVSNLTFYLKELSELGARKFVVSDVGPLGCIPYVRALEFMPAGQCSAPANRVTEGYNRKLRRMVEKMNREIGPESKFVYTDTYRIVMAIIQNHRQYGFDDAMDPCCGGSFPLPPFLCIGAVANRSSSTLCSDRSKYVFWDAFHPTEAANLIVAGKLLDGDAAAAWPINVRELSQYEYK